jgi:hypothetical protein
LLVNLLLFRRSSLKVAQTLVTHVPFGLWRTEPRLRVDVNLWASRRIPAALRTNRDGSHVPEALSEVPSEPRDALVAGLHVRLVRSRVTFRRLRNHSSLLPYSVHSLPQPFS